MAGTGLTLVVGTGNGEDVVLDVDSELLKDIELELALGALDDNVVAVDCHFDSGGNLDRLITDTRHGDLLSFYLPSELPDVSDDLAADVVLASIAVGHDAWLVEIMAVPRPPRTRGMSATPVYLRRPGLEMRRMPLMTLASWDHT